MPAHCGHALVAVGGHPRPGHGHATCRPRCGPRSMRPTSSCTPATGSTSALLDRLEARSPRLLGVLGNNDGPDCCGPGCPRWPRATLEGVRVAVVHETGPRTGREQRADAAYPDTDLLVFGHSHIPWDTVTPRRDAAAQPRLPHRPAPAAGLHLPHRALADGGDAGRRAALSLPAPYARPVSTPRSLSVPPCATAMTLDVNGARLAALDARPHWSRPQPPRSSSPATPGSKEDFLPLLEGLTEAGHRVLTYDQRGQYESAGAPAGRVQGGRLAADLLGVLDAVGEGPVHVVGHSFGGLVSRRAALQRRRHSAR